MEDISNEVTPKFYDDFKKGQTLGFEQDGVIKRYKIVRLDKRRKVVKIAPVTLYTEKELNDKLKQDAIDAVREAEVL